MTKGDADDVSALAQDINHFSSVIEVVQDFAAIGGVEDDVSPLAKDVNISIGDIHDFDVIKDGVCTVLGVLHEV